MTEGQYVRGMDKLDVIELDLYQRYDDDFAQKHHYVMVYEAG